MNATKKIVLLLLLYSFTGMAQLADKQVNARIADSVINRFNHKQFSSIYALTGAAFKQSIPEKDLVNLLENDLYKSLGKILKMTYLNADSGYYAYVWHFAGANLQFNLGVNKQEQIDFLQLLPYKNLLAGKRLTYQTDNKKQSGLDSLLDNTVVSYMQSPQNCGLSIGIYANGNTRYYNYGETARNKGKLPDENTIYEIGSFTKTFCGLLLAHAVIEKKINLNDDIRKYLPGKYNELQLNKVPILVKHLANHSSGLPGIPSNFEQQVPFDPLDPYKNYNKQMVFDYLKTIKPLSVPGTVCAYSNLGMALLGIILEDVYKRPFEELVKEKICDPNKMSSTAVNLSDSQQELFASGYNQDGELTPHWNLGTFVGAGGVRSSPKDMLTYLNYNLAETDSATKLAHQITYTKRETLGLAWFIKKTKQGNTLIWHNGGTYGFSSFGGFIKEKNCSVIILANSGTSIDYIGIAILNYLQQ